MGGFTAWKAAGLAVEAGESHMVPAEYGQPVRQDDWIVDGEAILARQAAGGLCLINALSSSSIGARVPTMAGQAILLAQRVSPGAHF